MPQDNRDTGTQGGGQGNPMPAPRTDTGTGGTNKPSTGNSGK